MPLRQTQTGQMEKGYDVQCSQASDLLSEAKQRLHDIIVMVAAQPLSGLDC